MSAMQLPKSEERSYRQFLAVGDVLQDISPETLRHKQGLKSKPFVWYEYLHELSSCSVSQTAYCVCPISLCPVSQPFSMVWSDNFARSGQSRMS